MLLSRATLLEFVTDIPRCGLSVSLEYKSAGGFFLNISPLGYHVTAVIVA